MHAQGLYVQTQVQYLAYYMRAAVCAVWGPSTPERLQTRKAWFSGQIFWQNATVALSLLFSNQCPIMV
jgi:hypothetical protein